MSKKDAHSNTIAQNRRARHDYFIEEQFQAGLVLEGWEVKSIRASRVHISESHVILKNGEAWLIGSHIAPLESASKHVHPVADRTRKLLLNQKELSKLYGAVERKGYTLIPLNLHWDKQRVKLAIALAKGKKLYDKRASEKDADWQREKARVLKER